MLQTHLEKLGASVFWVGIEAVRDGEKDSESGKVEGLVMEKRLREVTREQIIPYSQGGTRWWGRTLDQPHLGQGDSPSSLGLGAQTR